MSDFITQLFSSSGTVIQTGHVSACNGNGVYSVIINGKTISAKAAITGEIRPGMRVIVNSTASGVYISGLLSKLTERTRKEIVING